MAFWLFFRESPSGEHFTDGSHASTRAHSAFPSFQSFAKLLMLNFGIFDLTWVFWLEKRRKKRKEGFVQTHSNKSFLAEFACLFPPLAPSESSEKFICQRKMIVQIKPSKESFFLWCFSLRIFEPFFWNKKTNPKWVSLFHREYLQLQFLPTLFRSFGRTAKPFLEVIQIWFVVCFDFFWEFTLFMFWSLWNLLGPFTCGIFCELIASSSSIKATPSLQSSTRSFQFQNKPILEMLNIIIFRTLNWVVFFPWESLRLVHFKKAFLLFVF